MIESAQISLADEADARPNTQYCCPAFSYFPLGLGSGVGCFLASGQRRQMSRDEALTLSSCTRFASLREHIDYVSKRFAFISPPTVRQILETAASRRVLISSEEFIASSSPSVDVLEQKISSIVVPTAKRPDSLRACLDSWAHGCQVYGRRPTIIVADGSNDEASEGVTRGLLDDLQRSYGGEVFWAGVREKARLADALAATGCCPPDLLHFALFGDPGLKVTTGANRNALLLETTREVVLSVDDDTRCCLSKIPALEDTPALIELHDRPQMEARFFRDRQTAMDAAEPVVVDFLGSHEALLGRALGTIIADLPSSGALDVGRACTHLVDNVLRGRGTVVLTFSGVLGDSGTYATGLPLDNRTATREHAVKSESAYAIATSSREVLRGVGKMTICHGGPFMATAIGIDNRTLLPPFCPVMRNQDGVLGTVLQACNPEAFFGHVPIAVLHTPPDHRAHAVAWRDVLSRTRVSDLLIALIDNWPRHPGPFEQKLRALGTYLADIAALPAGEFAEAVTMTLLKNASSQYETLRRNLQESEEQPSYWRQDLESTMESLSRALDSGQYFRLCDIKGPTTTAELETARSIIGRYGNLVCCWRDVLACAQSLKTKGVTLSRRCGRGSIP